MNRFYLLIITILYVLTSIGQNKLDYAYFPENPTINVDWKWKTSVFWNEDENSNALTTEFFKVINKSGYISQDIIKNQLENMNDKVMTGQLRDIGFDFYLNSKRKPGKQYLHFAIQHQLNLDTDLDAGLLQLVLQGNKSLAGTTIQIPESKYTGLYFNQLKFGMGYNIETNTKGFHQLSWDVGVNLGQNYNEFEILNSSFYTHPDGDYLDIAASINTRLSDTVWAEVYDVNGLGLSADLRYAYQKPGDFNIGLNLNNLGFIAWAGNTYNGSFDSTFRFNGLANDSTTSLPDDYSWDGLRNLIFTNSSSESFMTTLPVNLQFTAGKYFTNEKFYAGINTRFYPTLRASYYLEGFFTWNYNNTLYLTPIIMYSSFSKLNYGLGLGWKITEKVQLHLGSSYLNSMFSNEGVLGSGGFVKLVFVN